MKKLNSWICLLLLVVAAGILPACSSDDGAGHGNTSDAETAAQHGEDQPPEQQGLPENPQGDAPSDGDVPSDGDAPTDDHEPEGESAPAPVDSRG